MQLTNKDREQLLNILLQTRRLTKIALATNAITYSEQGLILSELEQATAILQRANAPTANAS
ncbi:MAG: hypothetical protein QNK31_06940 [Porticoccus sp.]|nr:hypothetical protein [Porticoccus sp.]